MNPSLRVLTYNIHKGFGWRNKKFTLHQMRDAIRKVDPDVVFIQEIHGAHRGHEGKIADWPDLTQFEFLAEELWPHFIYGKNAIYPHGHHGNAILSRYEILSSENIDISESSYESRGLLHATIRIDRSSEPLHAICVHLGLLEAYRQRQMNAIVSRVVSHVPQEAPLILAGDFNDVHKTASEPLLNKLGCSDAYRAVNGRYALTYPSLLPVLPLDRIYFRNLAAASAWHPHKKLWARLSDHLPVVAEFSMKRAE